MGPERTGLNSGISKKQNHIMVANRSSSTNIKSNLVWRRLKNVAYNGDAFILGMIPDIT
jgi:hypothetical protein